MLCATRIPASSAPPTSAARSASPAGWPAAATTAASSSSTCATAAASCSSSSTRRARPEAHALAEQVRPEFVLAVTGDGRRALARDGQPEPADRRGRGPGRRARDPQPRQDAAVRGRDGGAGRRRRDAAPQVPLPRPAPRAHARQPRAAQRRDAGGARVPEREPLHRGRDAGPHEVVARGRAGLPRPLAPAAAPLLRAAAVAADVQADPHGRRPGPLLPVRALLPRRGPARRPPAGAHADRHRDVVPQRCPRSASCSRAS